MRCEYCEKQRLFVQPILLNGGLNGGEYNDYEDNYLEISYSDKNITAYIQDHKGCWVHDKFKINFCPMCGKNFKEE